MSQRSASPTRRGVLAASAAAVVGSGLRSKPARAQQVGSKRTDLQRHDLSIPGREVIQVVVELAPGVTAPAHSHPGEEIIYVIEGLWEYQVEGKPPVTLKAGEVLFIPAGAIHSAKNIGSSHGAELATYIVEKGKPLLMLAK
jgi:quercetin dioxygenase-like cupin family protein